MFWNRGVRSRLEALEKKHDELDEALARVTELEVDWQDYLHKMRNVLARLNQRARDDEAAAAPAAQPDRAPGWQGRSLNPMAARMLGGAPPMNGGD